MHVNQNEMSGLNTVELSYQLMMAKGRTKNSHVQDNEKYNCLACNRKYLRKKSLTRHLRYECGKQPLFVCPIDFCFYKAFYRIVLEKHIQTHMKKY